MVFLIDDRIQKSCIQLGDGPLSRVLLKNDTNYPWFILVPRENNIQELDQLSVSNRHRLMDEICELSSIVKTIFKPDKINVGALGNIVSQLHLHIVARFTHDKAWPHGIWQQNYIPTPYDPDDLEASLTLWRAAINTSSVFG